MDTLITRHLNLCSSGLDVIDFPTFTLCSQYHPDYEKIYEMDYEYLTTNMANKDDNITQFYMSKTFELSDMLESITITTMKSKEGQDPSYSFTFYPHELYHDPNASKKMNDEDKSVFKVKEVISKMYGRCYSFLVNNAIKKLEVGKKI